MSWSCKYGDLRCNPALFGRICRFCEEDRRLAMRQAELAMEVRRNEVLGGIERDRRASRDASYEAIGQVMVDHPGTTLGVLTGLAGFALIGSAIADRRERKKEKKEEARLAKPARTVKR